MPKFFTALAPNRKVAFLPLSTVALLLVTLVTLGLAGSCTPKTTRILEQHEERPSTGGILRMAQTPPSSLDPILSDSVYSSLPIQQIFDGLVRMDSALSLAPELAESWRVDRSATLYTFDLRRGVLFHDGSELAAQDVVFSLERALRPPYPVRSLVYAYLADIEGAKDFSDGKADEVSGLTAVDPWTVQIKLRAPRPSFLHALAMEGASIVPRGTLLEMGHEAFSHRPVGTGPFQIESWDDAALELRAFAGHHRGAPHLDGIEIRFLENDEPEFAQEQFRTGALDVIQPTHDGLAMLRQIPDANVQRFQELSLAFLGMRSAAPPLDQVWLRQAIAQGIHRKRLVAEAASTRRSADGVLPPGISHFTVDQKALAYDPERSRELLAENGHPGGVGLPPIPLYTASGGANPSQQIAEDLAAVGIPVKPVSVSWEQLIEMIDGEGDGMFLLAWIADLDDPDSFLYSLFASEGEANFFDYVDKRTDRLLERARFELNPTSRRQLYRQLEKHVLSRAPMVPLYHTRGVIATQSRVAGLEPSPLGLSHADLSRVWIRQERGL